MRRAITASALLIFLACNSLACNVASAQCCHECEPIFEFIDDLQCFPYGTCHRDPYEERMETERHDFTQSTKTVGKGVFQFEGGYTYFYKDEANEIEQAHATPEALLRLGLSDDIEFRIRWNYAWQFVDVAENRDSAQDLVWSIKLGKTEQCGWRPTSAIEFRSSLPTGGSDFSLGRVEAGFDYIYSWELCNGWELYGSTGYSPNGFGEFSLIEELQATDHFAVWSQSVALGIEVTERSVIYNEVFGLFSHARNDEFTIAFYNIGVDYYITNDLVIDFRIGVGLTEDSDDLFTGIGGGYRF